MRDGFPPGHAVDHARVADAELTEPDPQAALPVQLRAVIRLRGPQLLVDDRGEPFRAAGDHPFSAPAESFPAASSAFAASRPMVWISLKTKTLNRSWFIRPWSVSDLYKSEIGRAAGRERVGKSV